MKVVFHGHAGFSFLTGKHHILVDPFFTGNPLAKVKGEKMNPDFILLTHGHSDHVGDAREIARRTGALIIAPTELANWCAAKGLKAHGMYMGSTSFPFGRLTMVFASHGSAVEDNGQTLYGGLACGYVLELEGKRIYHAGDTGLFGDMQLIGRRHKPDLALLPIGGNYTMDPEEALEAAALIKAALTIPMHYNTFPLIRQDGGKFVAALASEGLKGRELKPEEDLEL